MDENQGAMAPEQSEDHIDPTAHAGDEPESATLPAESEPPFPPLHGKEPTVEAADTEAHIAETERLGFDPVARDVEGAAADPAQPDESAPSVVQNDPETAIDPAGRSHDELAAVGESNVPHAQLPVETTARDVQRDDAPYDVHAHVRHLEAGTNDPKPGHGLPTDAGRHAVVGTDEKVVGTPVKVIDPLTESHGLDNGSLPVHVNAYDGEIPKGSNVPGQAAPSDRQSGTSRFPRPAIGDGKSTDSTT